MGAPDLYLYFVHVCLGWLRGGDTLAFVLPNKLLVNTNAGRFTLTAKGVKIKGNKTGRLTLIGTQAKVTRALNAITLTFAKPHTKAKVTVSATAGAERARAPAYAPWLAAPAVICVAAALTTAATFAVSVWIA